MNDYSFKYNSRYKKKFFKTFVKKWTCKKVKKFCKITHPHIYTCVYNL